MLYSSESKEKEIHSKETERDNSDHVFQQISLGGASVSPTDEGGKLPVGGGYDRLFTFIRKAHLEEAQEFRLKGYNSHVPEVDPGLITQLREALADTKSRLCIQAGVVGTLDSLWLLEQVDKITRLTGHLSDGVIKGWIEQALPGKSGGETVETELGSRRTAQSLARRLETTLQTLIRIVRTLCAMGDYSTPEKRHDMLIAELTGAFSPGDKSMVIQALGRMTEEASGHAAWVSLIQARTAAWETGKLAIVNAMIESSRHEAEKANKKARVQQGASQAFFSDVAAYLQGLSGDLAKASINARQNASYPAIPLVNNDEAAAPLLRSNSLSQRIRTDYDQYKFKIQTAVEVMKRHAHRLARITKHGHPTGTPTKDPEHVVADSIIRSILWQWQQPAIKIQYASAALLSKVDELKKIEGIFASRVMAEGRESEQESRCTNVSHPGEDDMSAQVREWVSDNIEQEKPENRLAAKVVTMEQLLRGDVASARNLVRRFGKTEKSIQNMLRRQRFAVLKMIVERFPAVAPSLKKVDKLLPDITRDLTASLVALDKALQLAEYPTRNFSEAKVQAGSAQLLATKVKESLTAESARLTERPLDEHSRGSRLAKHWANLAKTQSMGNYPVPDAEQVLSSLQERGLLTGILSTGDPAGYLFATRLAGELENASNDELRLPMSPDQYTALEKELVEYIVKWGQRKTSHGVSRIVIELSFEQALDTVSFNMSSLLRVHYKLLKASIKIPYKVNKVNNYTMPGHDKPYKAIYGLLGKRLKQLGFNLVTAPVPGMIKFAGGAWVTAGATLHNLHIDNREKSFSAVYQHVAEGKQSEKIKMNSVKEMIFDSVTDTATTAAFKEAGRAFKSWKSENKIIPETRQLTGEDRNPAETKKVKLSSGAEPSIVDSSVARAYTANDSENTHGAAHTEYKTRTKRDTSNRHERSSYILHDDAEELSTNNADNLIVNSPASEILYTTELSKDEVVEYDYFITNQYKLKPEQNPLLRQLEVLERNKKNLESWISRELSAKQDFEEKLKSEGYQLINGKYRKEYGFFHDLACYAGSGGGVNDYVSINEPDIFTTHYYNDCPSFYYLDDKQQSVIDNRKLLIDDIKGEVDGISREIEEIKSIINNKFPSSLIASIEGMDEKINFAEDISKAIDDEIRNISAECILLDRELEGYELKLKKMHFIKYHLLIRKSLAYRHTGAIELLRGYEIDKFPERCNSYQDIINSQAKAAEIYCRSKGGQCENEKEYVKEYENILSRGGESAKNVEYMSMLILWGISHKVKDFDHVVPLDVLLNYTKLKKEYYNSLYFFDNVQPENYRYMNEMRSDFEFDSRSDYTKQYNDYIENGSSKYDAEKLTPSVVMSLDLTDDELIYHPEEISIYKASGMYSGSNTLVNFYISFVKLSSGRVIVLIYDYKGVRTQIISKEEIDKLKKENWYITNDPSSFYPHYSRVNNKSLMVAVMNLVKTKKVGSVKDAIYESLKANIDQFMRRRMIEAEHHGIPHELAVTFLPFYEEIYNHCTDSLHVINGERIILDLNRTIIDLAALGVNFSKLSTKSLIRISQLAGKTSGTSRNKILMKAIGELPETENVIAKKSAKSVVLEPLTVSLSRRVNNAKTIRPPKNITINNNVEFQTIGTEITGTRTADFQKVTTVAEIHPVPAKIKNTDIQQSGTASPSGGVTEKGTDLNLAKSMIEKSTQNIINKAKFGTESLAGVKPSKLAETMSSIEFTNKKLKGYAAHAVVISELPDISLVVYKRRFLNLPGSLSSKNTFPGIKLIDGPNGKEFSVVDKTVFINAIENSYKNKMGADALPLHPEIKSRIEKYLEKKNYVLLRGNGIPGLHAEVQAVNYMCHKFDTLNIDRQLGLKNTYIYTKRLVGQQNADFLACVNCSGILVGPENIMTGRIG